MNTKFLFHISLLAVFFFNMSAVKAQDDFKKWLKKDQQQFKSFLSEEDKAFSDFLKQEWQSYQSQEGKKRDVKPKPVTLPVVKEKEKPAIKPAVKPKLLKNLPIHVKRPVYKPKPKPVVELKRELIKFQLFDVPLQMDYKKDFNLEFSSGINNKALGTAWESMSRSDYKTMLEQLIELRNTLSLNDWGYIQLVQNFTARVIPKSENKQITFIWFILNKSGFDTRISYSQIYIYLLFPTSDLIYGNDFIQIEGTKYYFLKTVHKNFKLDKKVYSYKKTYKNDSKIINMRLKSTPNLKNEILERDLKFSFKGKDYTIPVKYEKDVITFFKHYPQTQLDVYFDAPMSTEANYSLLSALRPHVNNVSEQDAVNFLLRFVQTAFTYQTDDQQFGREKYLMPEETLFYPNSDCEDRSVLFSYLIKHLLGMRVIGLDYPGHISTAVLFNTPVGGKKVVYKNLEFTICDPTFVNADAGMCMPQFEKVKPKVISLF